MRIESNGQGLSSTEVQGHFSHHLMAALPALPKQFPGDRIKTSKALYLNNFHQN